MTIDIRDELDRSFGAGPAHPSVDEDLAAGRRALRRRRLATAAASACVVAVAGTAYAVLGSGDQPGSGTGSQVAVEPPALAPAWQRGEVVRYVDGQLEVRPGAAVHERLPNPFGYATPDLSDGLDLTFRGQRMWVLAEFTDGEGTFAASTPSNGWAGFDAWVQDQVSQSRSGWHDTMQLTDDGRVVAVPGAQVLQRTDDPQLGDGFAPPGTTTGAAVVDVGRGRPVYFVVWRVIEGELDVIITPPGDVVGATFEELLSYARAQYASGEGLR